MSTVTPLPQPRGVSAVVASELRVLMARYGQTQRDLAIVQDLLGHASPETTRHYVAPPREHLRRTVEAVVLRAA